MDPSPFQNAQGTFGSQISLPDLHESKMYEFEGTCSLEKGEEYHDINFWVCQSHSLIPRDRIQSRDYNLNDTIAIAA